MTDAMLPRRATIAAAMAGLAARPAMAQDAARPARLLVGFPPGGSTDTLARLFADGLRRSLRIPLVVENRVGEGGRAAVEATKAARPDGTTMLLTPASMLTIFPHLDDETLRHDALLDLAPVSPVCASPFALMVPARHPAPDLAGFFAWARGLGAAVPYASPAAGSMPHFMGVQLARVGGIQMRHRTYRGAAPALDDLVSGQVSAMVCILGEGTELHRAGRTRILAISSPSRLAGLPEVPSFAELGYPELTAEEWFGILLPAGSSDDAVEALHRAIVRAGEAPGLQAALGRLECRLLIETPAAFAARIMADRTRWGPVIAASGFRADG